MGATTVIDPTTEDPAEVVAAATRGECAAMVVEASGNFPAVMGSVEETLGVGGKVVIAGMDARTAKLNLIKYQLKAGSVYGTVGHSGSWDFPNVVNLMASGRDQHGERDHPALPAGRSGRRHRRDEGPRQRQDPCQATTLDRAPAR